MVVLCGCLANKDPLQSEAAFRIDFPLHRSAVYANWLYEEGDGALVELTGTIAVFTLHETRDSGDTTHLSGTMTTFSLLPFTSDTSHAIEDSGGVEISITDEWILLQDLKTPHASNLFLKLSGLGSVVDTMAVPTSVLAHYPHLPRSPYRGKTYAAYRPPDDSSQLYLDVLREIAVGGWRRVEDGFGVADGLEIQTQHAVSGIALTIYGLIDEHGMVASQFSFPQLRMSSNGQSIDTVMVHVLSRRLEDFVDPGTLDNPGSYAVDVQALGLGFLR